MGNYFDQSDGFEKVHYIRPSCSLPTGAISQGRLLDIAPE